MQTKKDTSQQRMLLLPPLEQFVPADHRLKRLNQVLDLSFVHEAVRDHYCQTNGRPSIDPEVLVRLFLLQAIENLPEVRELMRQVQVNLAYRYFIGYELDEKLPDHSTLSKALDRFGDGLFDELFSRSISQCQQSGLVGGKVLHVDATSIRADIDKNKVNKPDSSDPDARFGRFGDGRIEPGYKQQTAVDDEHGVILGVEVTAANQADEAILVELIDEVSERLELSPEAVCADGSYASGHNAAECEERQIRLVSPPQPVPKSPGGQYTIDEFEYDEKHNEFVCPAGKRLGFVGMGGKKTAKRIYKMKRGVCGGCPLQQRCTNKPSRTLTVGANHGALVRLRADHQSESFHNLYRRRAPVAEGVFADGKQRHGLRRAWRRGLLNMRIQSLLIATVINLKRLIADLCVIFDWIMPQQKALENFGGAITLDRAPNRLWPLGSPCG